MPLGDRYIPDAYAPSLRIVVEVDGGVHHRTRLGMAFAARIIDELM